MIVVNSMAVQSEEKKKLSLFTTKYTGIKRKTIRVDVSWIFHDISSKFTNLLMQLWQPGACHPHLTIVYPEQHDG